MIANIPLPLPESLLEECATSDNVGTSLEIEEMGPDIRLENGRRIHEMANSTVPSLYV